MEIKPEDELSNIVLFPVKEDDPRNQVNFLYEPSERPYCHHASVRVDEKERQVRCKICGAVVEPFDWMLSVGRCEQVPDMRSSYSSGAHPRGTS